LRLEKQPPQEVAVFRGDFHDVGDVLFGNYQQVHGGLRSYIVKSQDIVIFVYLVRRYFTCNDFTKNTITGA